MKTKKKMVEGTGGITTYATEKRAWRGDKNRMRYSKLGDLLLAENAAGKKVDNKKIPKIKPEAGDPRHWSLEDRLQARAPTTYNARLGTTPSLPQRASRDIRPFARKDINEEEPVEIKRNNKKNIQPAPRIQHRGYFKLFSKQFHRGGNRRLSGMHSEDPHEKEGRRKVDRKTGA